MENTELLSSFTKLYETIKTLRKKCPWDSVQTPETIRPLTIEEVYELSDAVLKGNPQNFKKELGDVCWYLFQTAYALNMPMDEIIDGNIAKLKQRHAHGFSPEYMQQKKGA